MLSITLPLLISFVAALVAAALTTGTGSRKVFRMGPVLLDPIMFLWGAAGYLSCSGECHDWWRTFPLHVGLAVSVLWHVALIATETEKKFYFGYAVFHIPIVIVLVH